VNEEICFEKHLLVKAEHIEKVNAKLIETSRIYRKNKETLDWHAAQDLFFFQQTNEMKNDLK